jgi:hypothetical protein
MASGEEKAPEEHAALLGQPSQALAFPAVSDEGPTHPSFAFGGASIFTSSVDDAML